MNTESYHIPEHAATDPIEAELIRRTVDVLPDDFLLLPYPQGTNKPLAEHSYGKSWVERAIEVESEVIFMPNDTDPTWTEAYGPDRSKNDIPKGKLGRFTAKLLGR